MEEKTKPQKMPKLTKIIVIISFIFYIWYFVSTLMLPLAEFINLPEGTYLTFQKIVGFPPAIIGFMTCVSLISVIIITREFNEQKNYTKMFLTESMSFMLYFIIPIIATFFLIAIIILKIYGQIPTEARISYFIEDLFLFTSALFLMTAVLNIATHKIIKINTHKTLRTAKKMANT